MLINAQFLREQLKIPNHGMTYHRDMLPQIPSDLMNTFINDLSIRGINHSKRSIKANALKATQSNHDHSKIKKLMGKGLDNSKPIIVSNDNFILDGHHRWLAVYNQNDKKPLNCVTVDLPIMELIAKAKEFMNSMKKPVDVVETIKTVVREVNFYK
jgi:hypothetical protein